MAARKRENAFDLPKLDEYFTTQEQRDDAKLKKINEIPLEEIDEFPDHPFKVLDDEDMMNLAESIREQGIITPATLRKKNDGRYEILSGHRRKRACELAGLETLRSEVVEMDRDAAVIFMVDSNLQRTTILPSEKAFSYKMRLEAMKRQGRRADLTSTPVVQKLKGRYSVELLGEDIGESREQVRRYIRLTELIPELLEKVDRGEIALRPAVDISYLPEDIQRSLLDTIEMEQCTPSYAQTRRMRTLLAEGKLTDEAIYAIMQEEKPNQKEKFTISASKIEKVLPQSVKASQREDFILKAIDYYAKHLQRKKEERER
ncbi:MAG: ParB/RepB/Spo0J family partition protein [Eubacteriales bacterium]|nr:ParB/RepB/Spo0J family partition protein [Eubacteriales bacterium]